MIKKVLTLAFTVFLGSAAMAQSADEQASDINEMADRITEMLTEQLALSEDQREEVYEATLEFYEDMAEHDNDTRGQIQKEYDEEMRETLNDEQYAQYMEGDVRKKMMHKQKTKYHNSRMHDKKDM